jgi:hypothetical protein
MVQVGARGQGDSSRESHSPGAPTVGSEIGERPVCPQVSERERLGHPSVTRVMGSFQKVRQPPVLFRISEIKLARRP